MNDGDAGSSGGVTLDGSLRAIVAADRLQLSESASGKHLLHRRLTVFYGYFALLALLAAVAGRFRHVLADVDPRIFHFVVTVQIAHACVLGIVFAALRFRVRGVTFMCALDVLATAATAGLVHRDVKPANVMLCTRGGVCDFVKVLDFGLVKDVAASSDLKITSERSIAGTPLYMAPESILSPETVGPAADIYAVGCVAYFLLTGRTPFEGDNLVKVCAAHVHDVPEPPSKYAPDVSPELDALVLRCLEKNADARPTTRELLAAFAG